MTFRAFADLRSPSPADLETILSDLRIVGFLVRKDAFVRNHFPVYRVYFQTPEDRYRALERFTDTFGFY